MGSIAFSKNQKHSRQWAGWVIRQILDDTAAQNPEDTQMAEEFDVAKSMDGLIVYLLPPEFAARVTKAIGEVATGILSGTIHSGVAERHREDERTIAQYREALQELLEAIPHSEKSGADDSTDGPENR